MAFSKGMGDKMGRSGSKGMGKVSCMGKGKISFESTNNRGGNSGRKEYNDMDPRNSSNGCGCIKN